MILWVIVGTLIREKLPGCVLRRMEDSRDHYASAVVENPGYQQAQFDRSQAPPHDPFGRPAHLHQGDKVPSSPYTADNQAGS